MGAYVNSGHECQERLHHGKNGSTMGETAIEGRTVEEA